jgi:hypothetical protein
MFKEVMNDLWLARISSLSNEVGLYVVLLPLHKIIVNTSPFICTKSEITISAVATSPLALHDKYVIVPADKASNNIVFE